jgi:hypothetical protein
MPTKQSEVKIKKSKNSITGIVNVTGGGDTGKTTFAMTTGAEPERTAFIDDDVKGKNIVRQVEKQGRKFAVYHNLMKESIKPDGNPMRELEFHQHCIKILDELAEMEGELDVIIWDTWTRFENTFHPVVTNNPSKFRQFYSPKGDIKGAEQWGAAFDYEAKVLDAMSEIAPLVILTSHLKKDVSKREIAEAKRPLVQKSFMRIYLRHTPNSPIPTGLFLKRPLKMDVSNGMQPVNVVHRKVTELTWPKLIEYWNNPVGNDPPSPAEQLNEFEMSILDGILTKDQQNILQLALIEAEREREEEARQARLQKKLITGRNGSSSTVPETPIALLTQAMSERNMDGEQLAETLGLEGIDDIMALSKKEVAEAWAKIK